MWYILDEYKCPIVCDSADEWASWISDNNNRIVASTEVANGYIKIWTIFLGANFGDKDHPLFFETRIVGGFRGHEVTRYGTWNETISDFNKNVEDIKEHYGV
jgi:hypothetical protein